jgi:hypothetical protein
MLRSFPHFVCAAGIGYLAQWLLWHLFLQSKILASLGMGTLYNYSSKLGQPADALKQSAIEKQHHSSVTDLPASVVCIGSPRALLE